MEPKILFSVPTNSTIEPQTTFAIAKIAQHPNVDYLQVMGSPTDIVRNNLVRILLANVQYTHLCMMDSNIIPPDNIIDLLLACDSP